MPGGPEAENLPSDAGGMGLTPGRGTKTPLAEGQLSWHTITTEPVCSRATRDACSRYN